MLMIQGLIKLDENFYCRDVLKVAPNILGKYLVHTNGSCRKSYLITEVEAYKGENDLACHARSGRTKRTEIMYQSGGHIYIYLIYGMYWMLNIVTGYVNHPEAILLRGIEGFNGPGKLSRELHINGSYYGENLCNSKRIWIADAGIVSKYYTTPRIGINYAGEPWISKPWRFVLSK